MKVSDLIPSDIAAAAERERRLELAKSVLLTLLSRADVDAAKVMNGFRPIVTGCVAIADELIRQTGAA